MEKSKKELLIKFPEIFSEGFGSCTKTKATFKIKEDVMPIFRPKRKVPFAAETSVSTELDWLKQIAE